MRLLPVVAWTVEGVPDETVDARLVRLLEALGHEASLAAAAAAVGLSYRMAWGLLRDWEQRLGVPLALMSRGRRAQLAPAGRALRDAHARAQARLAAPAAALALEIGPLQRAGRPAPLRIAASDDMALAQLRDALPAAAGLALDLVFRGSADALAAFARGEADLAGFHVAAAVRESEAKSFGRWLDARRTRLVRFIEREQGLIVAPGNPHHIRSLGDVARRRLRFVNRQPGSGTRLLVDQLLHRSGIAPDGVLGYALEERTHLAVAATVASGQADAGLGVQAAASQLGLGFVPLSREQYWFAVRASAVDSPPVLRFRELLQGEALRRIVGALAGYSAAGAGTVALVTEAFAARTARARPQGAPRGTRSG